MLSPGRALSLNTTRGRSLPKIDALADLYAYGCDPMYGQVIMIAGRSGSQKSGFALWFVDELNLPTLYFSADMSAATAATRIACKRLGATKEQVERKMLAGGESRQECLDAMADSNITFSFGSPIRWKAIDEELTAYVELHDAYPSILVFDNLQDFEGAESGYEAQMEVMQLLTELSRETGCTVMVMHHASDKSWDAKADPWKPPSRAEIKNGLSEKPELCLSVALNADTLVFNIAVVKQREGAQDPTGRTWRSMRCQPEYTRFHKV